MERPDTARSERTLKLDDGIEIRWLRTDDADKVYECTVRNREHLSPWMTWIDGVAERSDTYKFLRSAEKEALERTSFKAGIWRDRTMLGAIDLHDIDWHNRHASIGYWLDSDSTGQGIMTRAVRALVKFAFETLGLYRIEIHVATANLPSRRIPERLGFTLEGVLRAVQRLRGAYVDHAIYALLRDDAASRLIVAHDASKTGQQLAE